MPSCRVRRSQFGEDRRVCSRPRPGSLRGDGSPGLWGERRIGPPVSPVPAAAADSAGGHSYAWCACRDATGTAASRAGPRNHGSLNGAMIAPSTSRGRCAGFAGLVGMIGQLGSTQEAWQNAAHSRLVLDSHHDAAVADSTDVGSSWRARTARGVAEHPVAGRAGAVLHVDSNRTVTNDPRRWCRAAAARRAPPSRRHAGGDAETEMPPGHLPRRAGTETRPASLCP